MKIKKFLILLFFFFFILNSSYSQEKNYLDEVLNSVCDVSLKEESIFLCSLYPNYCKIILDKVYPRIKKKYKYHLLIISYIESQWKYRIGFYDKNDVSLYQINLNNPYVKKIIKVRKLNKRTLIYNTNKAAKVALDIYVLNIVHFYRKRHFIPKYDQDLIPLYHKVINIEKNYQLKVMKGLRKVNYKRILI